MSERPTRRPSTWWTWWLSVLAIPGLAAIAAKLWFDATSGPGCTELPGSPSNVWLWILAIGLVCLVPLIGAARRQRVGATLAQTTLALAATGFGVFVSILAGGAAHLCWN